jgi:hypothetical protein
MKGRRLKPFLRFVVPFTLALLVAVPTLASTPAQELYDKAVVAYENDNYLKALDLLNQSLKVAPDNKQALKLKLVIESELHPDGPGASGDGNSLWTYCEGQNSLDSDPEYLHVSHTASGPVTEPAYATMSVVLPAKTTEYEIIFKLKFGDLGGLPSGVILRSKDKAVLQLVADTSSQSFGTPDTTFAKKPVDPSWHEYHIRWRAGQAELSCDGHILATGPCSAMPDLLQFGGVQGKSGRQSEAFFQWIGLDYNVPQGTR